MIDNVALAVMIILIVSFAITAVRLIAGETVPDRVVALNHVGTIILAIALTFVLISGETLYMDVGLATILIVFTGTLMVARYLKRESTDD